MKYPLLVCLLALIGVQCADAPTTAPPTDTEAPVPVRVKKFQAGPTDNQLSEEERAAGFALLFDGESLDRWKGYNRSVFPYGGWKVRDGVLVLENPGEDAGDLITQAQYGNFDLRLDFALTELANTGIFYLAPEVPDADIWNNAPEYQLLDNPPYLEAQGAADMRKRLTGDLFGLYGADRDHFRADGAWNSARIVHQNGEVTHYLNGEKTIQYKIGSPEWDALIATTKFKAYPNFARAPEGHIGLQDHGQVAYFKNLRIKAL